MNFKAWLIELAVQQTIRAWSDEVAAAVRDRLVTDSGEVDQGFIDLVISKASELPAPQ